MKLKSEWITNTPLRWMLDIHRPHESAESVVWRLRPAHQSRDQAQIQGIFWALGLEELHGALATANRLLDGSADGVPITTDEIIRQYRWTGARYGPLSVTVSISSTVYTWRLDDPTPESLDKLIEEIYDPKEPDPGSMKPPAAWSAEEVNPRHPRWKLTRAPADGAGERLKLEPVHSPGVQGAHVHSISWQNGTAGKIVFEEEGEAECALSPESISNLVNRGTADSTAITVRIGETVYSRELVRPTPEHIQTVLDGIYDPNNLATRRRSAPDRRSETYAE